MDNNTVNMQLFAPILENFIQEYSDDPSVNVEDWLNKKISSSGVFQDKTEVKDICGSIIKTVSTNNEMRESLNKAVAEGKSAKSWFAEKIIESDGKISPAEIAKGLSLCGSAISKAIEQNMESNGIQCFSTENDSSTEQWNDEEWNSYRLKDLSYQVSDKLGTLAVSSLCDDSGYDLSGISDSFKNLPAELLEDPNLKSVVSGALRVAVNQNAIPAFSSETPTEVLSNIACVSLDKFNAFRHISDGKLSVEDGISQITQSTVSTVVGMAMEAKLMSIGTSIGAVFGPVGSVVGCAIGGIASRLVGTAIGAKIASVARKVSAFAKKAVSKIGEKVKQVGSKIKNLLFN